MELLHEIIDFIVTHVDKFGYWGIIIMMFLESSFFPFPSEVVMPPAGYLASIGNMNLFFVILSGIIGSILGALFNYFLAVVFGRRLFQGGFRYLGLSDEKFKKAENFLIRHGNIGTFLGRLLPVIRQYISFPAGVIRMKLSSFCLFTGIGSGIWVFVLTMIGYFVGKNKELVKRYLSSATMITLVVALIILVIYVLYNRRIEKNV